MGWGTEPDRVRSVLPPGGALRDPRRRRTLRAHRAARPGRRRWSSTSWGRPMIDVVDAAPQQGRPGPARAAWRRPGRPLLLLHGLGESSPDGVPTVAGGLDRARSPRSTSRGTVESTIPVGGGYTAEILLADADVALAELGEATVRRARARRLRRADAGRRPTGRQVVGAVLCDGPGLAGGATVPTSQSFVTLPPAARASGSVRPVRAAAATCARPTTRRLFVRLAARALAASTSRSRSPRSCGRRGWRRSSPSPASPRRRSPRPSPRRPGPTFERHRSMSDWT